MRNKINQFKSNLEQANLDPYIVIFHDILSDSEMDALLLHMKNLNLYRAEILTNDSGGQRSHKRWTFEFHKKKIGNNNFEIFFQRVAKLKFFGDDTHPILPRLTKRVEGGFNT